MVFVYANIVCQRTQGTERAMAADERSFSIAHHEGYGVPRYYWFLVNSCEMLSKLFQGSEGGIRLQNSISILNSVNPVLLECKIFCEVARKLYQMSANLVIVCSTCTAAPLQRKTSKRTMLRR